MNSYSILQYEYEEGKSSSHVRIMQIRNNYPANYLTEEKTRQVQLHQPGPCKFPIRATVQGPSCHQPCTNPPGHTLMAACRMAKTLTTRPKLRFFGNLSIQGKLQLKLWAPGCLSSVTLGFSPGGSRKQGKGTKKNGGKRIQRSRMFDMTSQGRRCSRPKSESRQTRTPATSKRSFLLFIWDGHCLLFSLFSLQRPMVVLQEPCDKVVAFLSDHRLRKQRDCVTSWECRPALVLIGSSLRSYGGFEVDDHQLHQQIPRLAGV